MKPPEPEHSATIAKMVLLLQERLGAAEAANPPSSGLRGADASTAGNVVMPRINTSMTESHRSGPSPPCVAFSAWRRTLPPAAHPAGPSRVRRYAGGALWPDAIFPNFSPLPARHHPRLISRVGACGQFDHRSQAPVAIGLPLPGGRPRYLNVQDCSIIPTTARQGQCDLVILQDFESKQATLRCDDDADAFMWLAALHLAKYETSALNEAFTGVMLSLKGPDLSDVDTLLSPRKRFPRFEWCNMRLPQVSSKWVKVYVAVTPGDSKKKGRVEVYTSDKMTKRSLVLYVNDADALYNVYPEDYKMIDFNSIMKLEGEVFVSKSHEHLFHHHDSGPDSPKSSKVRTRVGSSSSLASMTHNPPPPLSTLPNRSRSSSVNSTSSFFVNAPSPDPEASPSLTPRSPPSSAHFFKKQTANNFVTTNYLYLMPLPHPGVSAIEIMIRNFIHWVDTFKLYGRPEHLSSDKTDPESMLFGLPRLPCYGYLSMDDAYNVVEANFDSARYNSWGSREWKKCFKDLIRCKQMDSEYQGVGRIGDLFNSVDGDSTEENSFAEEYPSPRITLPKMAPRVASPISSKLRFSSTRDDTFDTLGALSFSDPEIGLNDGQYLGKPLDDKNSTSRPRSMELPPPSQMVRDDTIHSLEPIPDMPTPLDDPAGVNYFGFVDEKLRATPVDSFSVG
ncbi:hypothetical protein E0198_000223 [Clavispora lusitaniae]|nr:hypothetical protein E0198_000223 [Clavispora lusitaniae]